MSWKIKAIAGPFVGQEILIDSSKIIGRDPNVDIVLQGGHISRKHAELSLRGDQLWLTDLNSSNGTYVNGERITEVALKHNDQLQFDVVHFQVISALAEQLATTSDQTVAVQSKNTLPAALAIVITVLLLIALAWYFVA